MKKTKNTKSNGKLSLSLDLRALVVILLLVVGVMLFLWQPWRGLDGKDDQVVTVTGEAKVTARPDEFIFYPSYEFTNADSQKALAELTKKSDGVVEKLKELGVAEKDIKTSSNGYGRPYPVEGQEKQQTTYYLQVTATVREQSLAQKVQNYLLTTKPTGTVSPQANFGDAKRKELENQARDIASKDARAKAEQSARNLGFTLGSVKSITEGNGFGIPPIYYGRDGVTSDAEGGAGKSQLTIQPGENELNYTFSVTYYIR